MIAFEDGARAIKNKNIGKYHMKTRQILATLAVGAATLVETAQAWPTIINWPRKSGETPGDPWSPGAIATAVLVPAGVLGLGLGLWACSRREQVSVPSDNEQALLERGLG